MKTSIRGKIMIFSSVLLFSIFILQLLFGLFLSREFFVTERKKEINNLFNALKTGYSDDAYELSQITEIAENIHNIKITVFDGNNVIYSTRQSVDGFEFFGRPFFFDKNKAPHNNAPPMDFSNFSENPEVKSLEFDEKSFVLQGKIRYNGSDRYILLSSSFESIESSVMMFTKVNSLISVVILAAAIVCAFFVAKSINKPIKNIESVSKEISNLNFAQRADETVSTPELRNLAKSINTMSDKLCRTIEELQTANAKLSADIDYQKRLEKMQRDFIGNVSHEMKTPLCLLQMYGENLKNNVDGIDKEYYCQTIIDETERLNDMVRNMFEISSIENELYRLNEERVNLSELCSYTVSKMDILLSKADYETAIADNIFVNGDCKYLEQAIKNYLSNAIAHTKENGKIRIKLCAEKGEAIFSVYNQGELIAYEKLPHIWERFYKTDESRVRNEIAHSGLGLYIVKTVIEKMGGICSAENVNSGVLFEFRLPLV